MNFFTALDPLPLPPAPRPTNSLTDLLLTLQLSTQSLVLFFRHRPHPSKAVPFYLYQINLISATLFTFFGALLHTTDPLPVESSALWKAFLVTLSSTPILFPVIITLALTPSPSVPTKIFLSTWFLFTSITHMSLIIFELDLSLYLGFLHK